MKQQYGEHIRETENQGLQRTRSGKSIPRLNFEYPTVNEGFPIGPEVKLSGIYRSTGQSADVGQMIGLPSPALLASVLPNMDLLPWLRDIVDQSFSRQSYHPNASPEQDPCVSGFPRRANPSTDWAGGTEQPCSEYDGLMDDIIAYCLEMNL